MKNANDTQLEAFSKLTESELRLMNIITNWTYQEFLNVKNYIDQIPIKDSGSTKVN